ncbi:hypothetical protein D3C84_937720 [compost metagenome]
MVLPANQAGHAGAQGLVHQQVVQADEHRAQDQRDHCHPGQFYPVDLEEVGVRCALGQVDDPAQVTEQRHFDQRTEQADDQQRGEARPDLAQVIGIEGQDSIRRGRRRGVTEYVDQFFEAAIKHQSNARVRALLFSMRAARRSLRGRSGRPVQLSRCAWPT